tara:strand:- start:81 stop:182 length:102 start_codon:yes stop_codon:yes gene_type:complete
VVVEVLVELLQEVPQVEQVEQAVVEQDKVVVLL